MTSLAEGGCGFRCPTPARSPTGRRCCCPTVTYLGAEFVPAFTSAERLAGWPGKLDVLAAVEQAVQHGSGQEFPIDVTFPGEGEPDQVDTWITAHAEPFYIRA